MLWPRFPFLKAPLATSARLCPGQSRACLWYNFICVKDNTGGVQTKATCVSHHPCEETWRSPCSLSPLMAAVRLVGLEKILRTEICEMTDIGYQEYRPTVIYP